MAMKAGIRDRLIALARPWTTAVTADRASEPMSEPATGRAPVSAWARIACTIKVQGEVTGDENLLIDGRVDGSVDLKSHSVTVGPEGDVRGSIVGRTVAIEGKARGNLTAEQQIVLLSGADVEGDLSAPRVVLEDGARFRGGIDLGDGAAG